VWSVSALGSKRQYATTTASWYANVEQHRAIPMHLLRTFLILIETQRGEWRVPGCQSLRSWSLQIQLVVCMRLSRYFPAKIPGTEEPNNILDTIAQPNSSARRRSSQVLQINIPFCRRTRTGSPSQRCFRSSKVLPARPWRS
jgi:hypothetical protein